MRESPVIRRNPFWDFVKLFAMFCVVLGHLCSWKAMGTAETASADGVFISNFLSGMNMPLFYMVSGYFCRRMFDQRNVGKLFSHYHRYFWPLLSFGVLVSLLRCFWLWGFPMGEIPIRILKYIAGEGWFFYTLAWCELAMFLICLVTRSETLQFLMAYGVVGVLLMLPTCIWNVDRIIAMLPSFAVGAIYLERILAAKLFKPITISIGLVYILFCLMEGNSTTNGLNFYHSRFDISDFSFLSLGLVFVRHIIGVAGAIGMIGILNALSEMMPHVVDKVSTLGCFTLEIYYLHSIFIAILHKSVGLITTYLSWFVSATMVYLLCHFIAAITRQSKVFGIILWGEGLVLNNQYAQRVIGAIQNRIDRVRGEEYDA